MGANALLHAKREERMAVRAISLFIFDDCFLLRNAILLFSYLMKFKFVKRTKNLFRAKKKKRLSQTSENERERKKM
jgi:hypothetical protein